MSQETVKGPTVVTYEGPSPKGDSGHAKPAMLTEMALGC
jgi:hypothetical protein